MTAKFGRTGVITGVIIGGVALLGLMVSGAGDDPPAMQTCVIAAAIVFGCGLIAGAIEGRKSE